MTERPILCSGDEVRAILDGRKTQMRRPIKPQPDDVFQSMRSPFGAPGDVLWVRETWGVFDSGAVYEDVNGNLAIGCAYGIAYRADDRDGELGSCVWYDRPALTKAYRADERWRPSIHMPRWACRLTLDVLHVWRERVQDISGFSVAAEGFDCTQDFCNAWNTRYDQRGLGWDVNPWVRGCEFAIREVLQ